MPFLIWHYGQTSASFRLWGGRFQHSASQIIAVHAAIVTTITFFGLFYLFGDVPYIRKFPSLISAESLLNLVFDIAVLISIVTPQQIYQTVIFYLAAFLATTDGVVIGSEAWNRLTVDSMLSQAAHLADGKPYCIQIDNKNEGYIYREAQSRSDLHWRSMVSIAENHERPWDFHGLLAIEAEDGLEWRNWSYRNRKFTPVSSHTVELMHLKKFCVPRRDFVAQIK